MISWEFARLADLTRSSPARDQGAMERMPISLLAKRRHGEQKSNLPGRSTPFLEY